MRYWKIGITTVAATQDLLSGMSLVFYEKELIRLLNIILPEPEQPSAECPTVQTHIPYSIQVDQLCSKPVLYDSLYPVICPCACPLTACTRANLAEV